MQYCPRVPTDDALALFYNGTKMDSGASSSFLPLPLYVPSSMNYDASSARAPAQMPLQKVSTIELNMSPDECPPGHVMHAPPAPKARNRRKTRSELPEFIPSPSPAIRKRKRNHAEMDASIPNTMASSVRRSAVLGTLSTNMAYYPQALQMAGIVVADDATTPLQLITCRRRRTRDEHILQTAPPAPAIQSLAMSKSRRTRFELDTARYIPPSAAIPLVLKGVGTTFRSRCFPTMKNSNIGRATYG